MSRAVCICLLILALWGCSNDIEMPSAYHRGYLAQPTGVSAEVEAGGMQVRWQMASVQHVAGFVVSFTDAGGNITTRFVADPAAISYEESALDLSEGAFYLVEVWAVDERDFYGPRSAADTLAVQ